MTRVDLGNLETDLETWCLQNVVDNDGLWLSLSVDSHHIWTTLPGHPHWWKHRFQLVDTVWRWVIYLSVFVQWLIVTRWFMMTVQENHQEPAQKASIKKRIESQFFNHCCCCDDDNFQRTTYSRFLSILSSTHPFSKWRHVVQDCPRALPPENTNGPRNWGWLVDTQYLWTTTDTNSCKKVSFQQSFLFWPNAMDELQSIIEKQLWRRVWLNCCTRPIFQQGCRIHETYWNITTWHRVWNLTLLFQPRWEPSASTTQAPWGLPMTQAAPVSS